MSTLLQRQLDQVRELLEARDLDGAALEAGRMVRLHPLAPEARLLAARVAMAAGDQERAGAHLFLGAGATGTEQGADTALAAFHDRAARDPLAAFLELELRDVPDPARLEGEVATRLSALLERLAERDYPVQRLDAMLYGQRRGLSPVERIQAMGCLGVFTLASVAILALAVVGAVALLR